MIHRGSYGRLGLVSTDIPLPDHRPRLVATDLDGTIVRSDGKISPRTVAALDLIERAGCMLVFVTGRPPRWMPSVAEATGHHGLAICANGAILYDLRTERVVEQQVLDPARIRQVVEAMRREMPDIVFACEYGKELWHEADYPVFQDAGQPGVRTATLAELCAQPAAKLLARHRFLDSETFMRQARAVAGAYAEFTYTGYDGLLEISASGVSKASGLARFCVRHGIDAADVIAVGDMPNDLPMLAWAGTGYAVANAHPDVLAAVDRHLPSNDEDGVAQLLERLFNV